MDKGRAHRFFSTDHLWIVPPILFMNRQSTECAGLIPALSKRAGVMFINKLFAAPKDQIPGT
jgi:hypothetical protein